MKEKHAAAEAAEDAERARKKEARMKEAAVSSLSAPRHTTYPHLGLAARAQRARRSLVGRV